MNIFIDITLIIMYLIALYFSIFLLLVYIDKKDKFEQERSDNSGYYKIEEVLVSVLVPAYNEENTIIKTLESIDQLDYPKDKLEVIIINDGSKDNTEKVVKEYIKNKPNFNLISHANIGKAASMNKALNLAKGEFFACLDADSSVDRMTLRKMLAQFQKENDPNLAIITPAMKVIQPKNLLQRVQWLEYIVLILIARISSHLDSLYVAPGPFSLYQTSIIKKLGGFEEGNIAEDQEIAYRAQKNNYRILHCFDGYVYTNAPMKLKPFYRQRRRWYLGSIICLHKYKDLVANKKYGDFGLMQMIKNVVGYVTATFGIIILLYFFIVPFFGEIKSLLVLKFNILPFLQHFKLNITFLNFLLNDFRKGILVLFLFLIGFYFFYQAHRNANEKMIKFGWIPLIPYFAFYYILKGVILLLSLLEFSMGKKLKW